MVLTTSYQQSFGGLQAIKGLPYKTGFGFIWQAGLTSHGLNPLAGVEVFQVFGHALKEETAQGSIYDAVVA